MSSRPLVVFAFEWMPTYRAGFYEVLRPRLDARGIDMRVVHGSAPGSRKLRGDGIRPEWATHIENRMLSLKGTEVTWQPVIKHLKGADMVVVQHEAALPLNYLLLARRKLGGPKVAFWGHGAHFNPGEANRAAEVLKQRVTKHADWFFAYTQRSADIVESNGLPRDRITVTNNSRSSDALNDASPSAATKELVAEVNGRSRHKGWMISALDKWKRVPFLIETIDDIRQRVPDFEFFLLGSGATVGIAEEAAATRPWFHVLGPTFAGDKRLIGESVDITIHPGLIGLHVVDSFAFQTPIITTEYSAHSHEFDYLETGDNSVVLPEGSTAIDLGAACASVLQDPALLSTLQAGCLSSSQHYSLANMADRYANGVEQALAR